ncbi:hydroxyacid oxidase 1-like protein [Anaeromyces robustus]|jgi:(S)-2-hydroxy-acid oxidase|uniref:Oxidase FUB9 n=1 Tax=Anaeromyces robustus TaxID=1754192 RepID=A0A1Y1XL68_9FUNG|nr:hydroxyacid oxidase 1-like protein [Anaeromyces robustus]ORX86445.1 hydroxyacid oxidase 1-like protein [Anaeromyces robustus]|eukprot:ORX42802.1 hydroxyacid oxidase 1-like protein [Anaeromyces robustus]
MAEEKLNPISLDDFHNYAYKHLPKMIYEYYAHGANNNETVEQNLKSYLKYRIRPRVMRDVSQIDTSVEVFGHVLPIPIGIAPVAMQKMAHISGEIGMAKGATEAGTLMIVSSFSTTNLEDIVRENPNAFLMFQLYVRELELTKSMIKHAEKNGFKGIVLTVDTPLVGKRVSDKKNNFQLPKSLKIETLEPEDSDSDSDSDSDDDSKTVISNVSMETVQSETIPPLKENTTDSLSHDMSKSLTWEVIKKLKKMTKLPILLKGILTEEDAEIALEFGADGIIVSNHGGRQLDTVCTTLEALPEIAKVVNKRIPVFLDGGIRRGSDVFKAIALGADAVFVGRPAIWALNAMGAEGVKKMMDILTEEFRLTMALAGCTSIDQITPKHIQHKKAYISSKL